jgi:hypothetical protein
MLAGALVRLHPLHHTGQVFNPTSRPESQNMLPCTPSTPSRFAPSASRSLLSSFTNPMADSNASHPVLTHGRVHWHWRRVDPNIFDGGLPRALARRQLRHPRRRSRARCALRHVRDGERAHWREQGGKPGARDLSVPHATSRLCMESDDDMQRSREPRLLSRRTRS